MKETTEENGSHYYSCERCGFVYQEREWAEKCEAWCSAHNGCNLDITQHAVKPK